MYTNIDVIKSVQGSVGEHLKREMLYSLGSVTWLKHYQDEPFIVSSKSVEPDVSVPALQTCLMAGIKDHE